MFQISAGHGVRHFEPPKPLPRRQMVHPRRLDQLDRDGAQRLVQAERHVPGLRGEDRKDRGALDPEQPAREQRDKAGHGDRQKAEDRHRLQDIEHRYQDLLGLTVLRGERGINQAEDQGRDQRGGHSQHRAQRVFGQPPRIERDRQGVADVIARGHRQSAPGDQRDQPAAPAAAPPDPSNWGAAATARRRGEGPNAVPCPRPDGCDWRATSNPGEAAAASGKWLWPGVSRRFASEPRHSRRSGRFASSGNDG